MKVHLLQTGFLASVLGIVLSFVCWTQLKTFIMEGEEVTYNQRQLEENTSQGTHVAADLSKQRMNWHHGDLDKRNGNKDNAALVLTQAYFRSGSTYFSELFNLNENAFYVFEPLFIIQDQQNNTGMRNDQWFKSTVRILQNIFNCTLDKLPRKLLIHRRLSRFRSIRHGSYSACLEKNAMSVEECAEILNKICLSSQIRAVKVIRIHGRSDVIAHLMKAFPNMKLIQLMRDPRGILSSREKILKHKTRGQIRKEAGEICETMRRDICDIAGLNIFAQRIQKIIYENLAEDPSHTINQVYAFLKKPVSPELIKSIVEISASEKTNGRFGTRRADALKTAYGWMRSLDVQTKRLIDDQCEVAYIYGGYEKATTDFTRDQYILRKADNGFSANESCSRELE